MVYKSPKTFQGFMLLLGVASFLYLIKIWVTHYITCIPCWWNDVSGTGWMLAHWVDGPSVSLLPAWEACFAVSSCACVVGLGVSGQVPCALRYR